MIFDKKISCPWFIYHGQLIASYQVMGPTGPSDLMLRKNQTWKNTLTALRPERCLTRWTIGW
jgi:hypothetical protein